MTDRYEVVYDGAWTRIIETPAGEWGKFNVARFAAIEYLEGILAEGQTALDVLRSSGNFFEYGLRQAASVREQESLDVRFVTQEEAKIPSS